MIGSKLSDVRITKDHQYKHWCFDSVLGKTYLSRESSRKRLFNGSLPPDMIRTESQFRKWSVNVSTIWEWEQWKIKPNSGQLIRPSSPQVHQEQTLLKITAAIFITATTMNSSIKSWLWPICWKYKIRAWMPGSDVTYFSRSVWTVNCDLVPN